MLLIMFTTQHNFFWLTVLLLLSYGCIISIFFIFTYFTSWSVKLISLSLPVREYVLFYLNFRLLNILLYLLFTTQNFTFFFFFHQPPLFETLVVFSLSILYFQGPFLLRPCPVRCNVKSVLVVVLEPQVQGSMKSSHSDTLSTIRQ